MTERTNPSCGDSFSTLMSEPVDMRTCYVTFQTHRGLCRNVTYLYIMIDTRNNITYKYHNALISLYSIIYEKLNLPFSTGKPKNKLGAKRRSRGQQVNTVQTAAWPSIKRKSYYLLNVCVTMYSYTQRSRQPCEYIVSQSCTFTNIFGFSNRKLYFA